MGGVERRYPSHKVPRPAYPLDFLTPKLQNVMLDS